MATEDTMINKLERIVALNPPTKAGISLHLVLTWIGAGSLRFAWPRLLSCMTIPNPGQVIPHLPGVWWLGCCAQLVITVTAFTVFRNSLRQLIPFLYGYWICASVAMLGTFFEFMFVDKAPIH
jgi:hypothetical protein